MGSMWRHSSLSRLHAILITTPLRRYYCFHLIESWSWEGEAVNQNPCTSKAHSSSPPQVSQVNRNAPKSCLAGFHKALPSHTPSPLSKMITALLVPWREEWFLHWLFPLLFGGSCLLLCVVSRSSCRWQRITPHRLSIWFMLESISSGSLVWLQIIPQVPLVLCPQGFPFIVLTKQVQMSLLTSLLSLDCPFISELRDPAETGESSKTFSGRPKAQNSCVSLSRYEKIKVPSGSQPDLIIGLFFSLWILFQEKGAQLPPPKFLWEFRVQVGSQVPRLAAILLSSVRGFAIGDVRWALPHLENPLRKMHQLHQICQSFPVLMRKMPSTLLPMGYGYSFSFFSLWCSSDGKHQSEEQTEASSDMNPLYLILDCIFFNPL